MNDIERYAFWHSEMDEFLNRRKEISKYNQEIDKAAENVRNGKFISNEEVIEELKKW